MWFSGSRLEMILWAVSRYECYSVQRVEVRDAVKHLVMHSPVHITNYPAPDTTEPMVRSHGLKQQQQHIFFSSLSINNSRSPPKPMSIESVMLSNHLILCRPRLLLPSVFPSIRVCSNETALRIRWPKYWSFSFNISLPMNTQD